MPADERQIGPGEQRRRVALSALGLRMEASYRLHDVLASSLSAEIGGYPQFAGIASLRVRAVASDLVLTAADAIQANLAEAALHARAYSAHIGPHGRTMPGPATTADELLEDLRTEAELVGFFRAIGSTLDSLGAAIIGVLRLPTAIQRADASWVAGGLDRLLESGFEAPDSQVDAAQRISDELRAQRDDPRGWLEWTVEMRNRVIHRARQFKVWLPVRHQLPAGSSW